MNGPAFYLRDWHLNNLHRQREYRCLYLMLTPGTTQLSLFKFIPANNKCLLSTRQSLTDLLAIRCLIIAFINYQFLRCSIMSHCQAESIILLYLN